MSDTPQTINGALLRLKRESHGWLVSDLATRACMSVKQIRQLEEGGSSSFYSESVKLTSAKKVGTILGLTPDEVFGVQKPPAAAQGPADETDAHDTNELVTDTAHALPESVAQTSDSQAMPFVQPAAQTVTPTPVEPQATSVEADVAAEQKNKTPLSAIAALFVAALAVAAWMRPEPEPVVAEPPPPLQTLPAEKPDPAASAASSAETSASATVAATPASAASTAVRPASAAVTVNAPTRPPSPAASAPAGAASTSPSPSASKPL